MKQIINDYIKNNGEKIMKKTSNFIKKLFAKIIQHIILKWLFD